MSARKASAAASFVLIFALVLAMLFSLLSISGLFAKEKPSALNGVLATKTVEASVWRLKNPGEVCFKLDANTVKSYPFLGELTREADTGVSTPTTSEDRYDGYATRVEGPEAVPLVRSFDFHHDVEEKSVRNISDEVHTYSCNVEYNRNRYFLQLKFYAISYLDKYAGYLPITINDQALEDKSQAPSNSTVFKMFNNTAVWENKSGSWITLHVVPEPVEEIPADELPDALNPITMKLAPSASRDLYLGIRLGTVDTVYHYQIQEYPWVQGDILLKNHPVCMDFDTARSLYSATKFPFKAPSYAPEGYEYKCMQADTASVQMFYSNRTFLPEFMGEGLAEGQIEIRISDDDRRYGIERPPGAPQTDEEEIRSQYENILKNNPSIEPQLVDINGKLAWAHEASGTGSRQTVVFPDGSQITTTSALPARLRLYDNGTGIHLEGYVPVQELVKMAESLE